MSDISVSVAHNDATGWTRRYEVEKVADDNIEFRLFEYDENGNCTRTPHGPIVTEHYRTIEEATASAKKDAEWFESYGKHRIGVDGEGTVVLATVPPRRRKDNKSQTGRDRENQEDGNTR